ncbi:ABC transporter permease [Streptosporangiaceae bacterium NEAU-GS5]|nr:ABC transporter permease [Streptosporangiaceae bacterium NEAU-GS5]
MRLVKSELQKLFTTRLWWIMLIVMLLLVVLQLVFLIAFAGQEQNGAPGIPALDDPGWLPIAFSAASTGNIFTMILGVVMMTSEYRYQTITGTLLVTPKRTLVIAAKLMSGVVVGLLFAVVALVFVGIVAVIAVVAGGGTVSLTAHHLPQVALGILIGLALYTLFGIGLGALVRNQIAALVGAIVWSYVIESIFAAIPALQPVGKWLPRGAYEALMDVEVNTGLGASNLLPVWGGALVLIGYGLAFALVASLTTTRRDIT